MWTSSKQDILPKTRWCIQMSWVSPAFLDCVITRVRRLMWARDPNGSSGRVSAEFVPIASTVGEPEEGSFTYSKCHVCARGVVAMYMTFRRLRAWEVDLLITVSKFICHFLDKKFHHLYNFHFR